MTKFALKLNLPIDFLIKKSVYKQFCGGENRKEFEKIVTKLKQSNIGVILDYSAEAEAHESSFDSTKKELLSVIAYTEQNNNMPFSCMKISGIGRLALLEKASNGETLSNDEQAEYHRIILRLDEICKLSHQFNHPIYIDAEESWVQIAIDAMAEEMMEKYNKEKVIVFTTLQMYRHDKLQYFEHLIALAKEKNFKLGVKIVRGAYLEKENNRAIEMGYPSPINIDKEATDKCFNDAIKLALRNIDILELCAGTHNEESCLRLVDLMKQHNIPNNHQNIWFSQLYGMSDHISYNLAKNNYNVSKYLPYGPVKSAIPYLIRRAQENTAIAGQMGQELKLLIEERKRRQLV